MKQTLKMTLAIGVVHLSTLILIAIAGAVIVFLLHSPDSSILTGLWALAFVLLYPTATLLHESDFALIAIPLHSIAFGFVLATAVNLKRMLSSSPPISPSSK